MNCLFREDPLTAPSGHLSPSKGERQGTKPLGLAIPLPVQTQAPILAPFEGERWLAAGETVRGSARPHKTILREV